MRQVTIGFGLIAFGLAGCLVETGDPAEEAMNDAWLELQNDDGSADSARCSGVVVPDRGPLGGRIALTFDDGPSLTTTPRVLDVLARHGATATFFVNGKNVTSEAHWALLRRMVAEGHIVANHTTNHPNSVEISLDRFRSEVSRTHEVIEELGLEPSRRFFRFPFGSANCSTVDVVQSHGYRVTGWHIDTADWCFNSSTDGVGYCSPRTFRHVPDGFRSDYVGFTLSQARSHGGGVLLMHDVHAFTANNLDAVLTALEGAGYRFVGLDDASTFPQLNGRQAEDRPWIGTVCAETTECDFTYGERSGYCAPFADGETGEDRGFCSMTCEGYCPDRNGYATTFCVESAEAGVGMCVPRAEQANGYCAELPGTAPKAASRFVGSSGASPSTATVCLP